MAETFAEWFRSESRKRKHLQRDIVAGTGFSKQTINGLWSGRTMPGEGFARALAAFWGLPPEEVFRAAGKLPTTGAVTRDVEVLAYQIMSLSPNARRVVASLIESLRDDHYNE